MKKIYLYSFIYVLTLLSTRGQAQLMGVGFKGGLNMAYLAAGDEALSYKEGIHIGFYYASELASHVGFQPELVYSRQGARITVEKNNTRYDVRIKYDYLNLPLMVKLYPSTGFNLQVGPQIGFLMRANVIDGKTSVSAYDQVKGVDLGLGFGLGHEIEAGFNVSARYNIGLISTGSRFDAPNRVFQLSIVYTFSE